MKKALVFIITVGLLSSSPLIAAQDTKSVADISAEIKMLDGVISNYQDVFLDLEKAIHLQSDHVETAGTVRSVSEIGALGVLGAALYFTPLSPVVLVGSVLAFFYSRDVLSNTLWELRNQEYKDWDTSDENSESYRDSVYQLQTFISFLVSYTIDAASFKNASVNGWKESAYLTRETKSKVQEHLDHINMMKKEEKTAPRLCFEKSYIDTALEILYLVEKDVIGYMGSAFSKRHGKTDFNSNLFGAYQEINYFSESVKLLKRRAVFHTAQSTLFWQKRELLKIEKKALLQGH